MTSDLAFSELDGQRHPRAVRTGVEALAADPVDQCESLVLVSLVFL